MKTLSSLISSKVFNKTIKLFILFTQVVEVKE